MKCDKCGYDDNGTGETAHVCGPINLKLKYVELHEEFDRFEELMAQDQPKKDLPCSEQSLVFRLRKRAEIRRQIPGRKSVQEGASDRIADLLEEAAAEIERLQAFEPQKPLPDANVSVKMKCQDCGHIQLVKGQRMMGSTYFGSAYNFCDVCGGLPEAIEEMKVEG